MKETLPDELEQLLEEIRQNGALFRPPVSPEVIELTIEQFSEKFRLPLPMDYLLFLRKTNGINWEDAIIAHILDPSSSDTSLHTFSANDLISLNDHYRRTGLPLYYIVLGFDDLGLYAHHTQNDTYHLLHAADFTPLQTHPDFPSLLEEIIEGPI